jgi:glycosyltransferase involved in cell wall biosynthesis
MILFGHPTGNPNSHHAALAHYEAGRLEAFCVPWFPGRHTLDLLSQIPGAKREEARLRRRRLEALGSAPKIQGRVGEWSRLLRRKFGLGDEQMMYNANDWLMQTMARAARRSTVTAVHSYEDCSLWQFQEAKRLGKQCIYDMPIGYYLWWDEKQKQLAREYADWVPAGGLPSSRYVRPEQKIKEMELADLVLVACGFVEKTVREFHPDKKIALAPYGVDAEFWSPGGTQQGAGSREHGGEEQERLRDEKTKRLRDDKVRFIYAGGCSIRKGIPVLLEAWKKAQLREAELLLVGSWQLAESKLKQLPRGVKFVGPVGPEKLRDLYRASDVFVFPSFFEGFGLVILEALGCGLPVIASDCSAGPDVLDGSCGRVVAAGDLEQLVETLRWFDVNRDRLPAIKAAARNRAESLTWSSYRAAVSDAVAQVA